VPIFKNRSPFKLNMMSTTDKNVFAEASHDLIDAWFKGMKKWQDTATGKTEQAPFEFVNDWVSKQQEFFRI